MAVGDWDGDGYLDVYLTREGEPNVLLRNLGGGQFREVTAQSEAAGTPHPLADAGSGRSAGFLDHDGDGDLDLYLVNAGGANRLYRNEGGRFTEVGGALGVDDVGDGRGLAIGDYDEDGDPDLFVANLASRSRGAPSRLYRNEAGEPAGRFVAVEPAAAGLPTAGLHAAAVFGDADGDGLLDLLLSDQSQRNGLWLNRGGSRFERLSPEAGGSLGVGAVGAAMLDADNDGDLDVALTSLSTDGAGDQLYDNCGTAGFIAVGGLVGLRPTASGRGVVVGDWDGDGRQDLLVTGLDSTVLYRNEVRPAHWLAVELRGLPGNSAALGARVEVWAGGQRQVRQVQAAYGYCSQGQPRLHFGLGTALRPDSLRLTWPEGSLTRLGPVRADRRLVLGHPGRGKAVAPEEAVAGTATGLGEAWPNPFNGGTVIPFQLAVAGRARLEVYSVTGQRVRRLVAGPRPAGDQQVAWDGRDEAGRPLGSGIYLCRLEVDGQSFTRRLLLVK
ncbi:MAG: FG-GAP-like repeat-containing protein [Candidatus Latescibacterota bacterium]